MLSLFTHISKYEETQPPLGWLTPEVYVYTVYVYIYCQT